MHAAAPSTVSDDPDRAWRLDRRPRVLAVVALGFATMLGGLLASPHPYGSVAFLVDFVVAELALAAVLVVATFALLPPARVGLRSPRVVSMRRATPMGLLLAAAVVAWLAARASLPDGASLDAATSWRVLRTTALVGFNEELLFRGVVLAAFWRWWGPVRGAYAACAAFGAFHLLNVAAGSPPSAVALQFAFTATLGAVFVLGAVGTRSLWAPMIVHAIYDAVTFDLGRAVAAGAGPLPTFGLMVFGLLLGLVSLAMLRRLDGPEPYPR